MKQRRWYGFYVSSVVPTGAMSSSAAPNIKEVSMNWTRLWPTVASLIAVLAGAFEEPVKQLVVAHPTESMAVAGVLTVIANLMRSPKQ